MLKERILTAAITSCRLTQPNNKSEVIEALESELKLRRELDRGIPGTEEEGLMNDPDPIIEAKKDKRGRAIRDRAPQPYKSLFDQINRMNKELSSQIIALEAETASPGVVELGSKTWEELKTIKTETIKGDASWVDGAMQRLKEEGPAFLKYCEEEDKKTK